MKRITFLAIILFPLFTSAQRIYVNHNASGDQSGTSWVNAYNNLEKAIEAATIGDQIWVAEGTYFPFDFASQDRDSFNWEYTFNFNKDIQIYGGFDGTETVLEARNPEKNPTILTGKFSCNNETYQINTVVSFSEVTKAALLDGFTVEHGEAKEGTINIGGGIMIKSEKIGTNANPIIKNCIVQNNKAFNGGGVACLSMTGGTVSPRFINCKFKGNESIGKGGAIYSYGNTSNINLVVENTIFSNNRSQVGGAVCLRDKNADFNVNFTRCTFKDNQATKGGAVHTSVDGALTLAPKFTDCKFISNQAAEGYGGAFYNYAKGGILKLILDNTIFTKNTAEHYGGAIANVTTGGNFTPIIKECSFKANSANQGGAIYNYGGGGMINPKITFTTFIENSAQKEGRNIMNFSYFEDLKVEIENCTFAKNESKANLGSIFNNNNGSGTFEINVINSIYL